MEAKLQGRLRRRERRHVAAMGGRRLRISLYRLNSAPPRHPPFQVMTEKRRCDINSETNLRASSEEKTPSSAADPQRGALSLHQDVWGQTPSSPLAQQPATLAPQRVPGEGGPTPSPSAQPADQLATPARPPTPPQCNGHCQWWVGQNKLCGRPCAREDGHLNLHKCSSPASATHQPPRGAWSGRPKPAEDPKPIRIASRDGDARTDRSSGAPAPTTLASAKARRDEGSPIHGAPPAAQSSADLSLWGPRGKRALNQLRHSAPLQGRSTDPKFVLLCADRDEPASTQGRLHTIDPINRSYTLCGRCYTAADGPPHVLASCTSASAFDVADGESRCPSCQEEEHESL